MNTTTVTTPNELEIRVERIFDAPRTHVFSVWTDPKLIPEWWGDGTVVEEMDVRPGGTYRFRTAYGVVEGEFREVDAPERLVQTFQNHLQTLEFEDLGDRTKLTQTMRFATTEERDTTMQYGVEEGAKAGFASVDALLQRLQDGDTMSTATRTDTQSPALHVADRHDLIRVHGARVNNLKDVSIEIPKRRLTVFTGVSGSGKSSLVFGTIAAESQRLINETYSAFVQGFMPTMARPEVDVLDGLTTAIIVDQERMGGNPRSTVGTATDANALLRILFSRLGKPHIGPPIAYSFNVPTRTASGAMTVDKGKGERIVVRNAVYHGGMCPRCEGRGSVTDFDLSQLYDDSKSLNEGALTIPGYSMDGWYGRIFRGCGFFDPDKPIRKFTKKELDDLLYKEPTKIKVDGHQPDVLGSDPDDPEVVPVQGRRRAAAAHPRLRGAGGDVHHVPRVRRQPAERGGSVVEDQGEEHRRRLRDADQRPGRLAPGSRRAVGGAAAHRAATPPRLVRGDRVGLPLARPAVGHPVRGRGTAHQDDPPPRLVAHRRHLRVRRAHDRAAPS